MVKPSFSLKREIPFAAYNDVLTESLNDYINALNGARLPAAFNAQIRFNRAKLDRLEKNKAESGSTANRVGKLVDDVFAPARSDSDKQAALIAIKQALGENSAHGISYQDTVKLKEALLSAIENVYFSVPDKLSAFMDAVMEPDVDLHPNNPLKLHAEQSQDMARIQSGLREKEIAKLGTAIAKAEGDTDNLRKELKQNITQTITQLNTLDDKGIFSAQYLYDHNRTPIKDRYQLGDVVYEGVNRLAIDRSDATERAWKLRIIPEPIQKAKWTFLTRLHDAICCFRLEGSPDQPEKDDPNLLLLTALYQRLSEHERGASNRHIPPEYKYRHNPAIHSLHVATLVAHIFHKAKITIINNKSLKNDGDREAALQQLAAIRQQVMMAVLVHDGGELEGEITQGIQMADKPKPERDRIIAAKEKVEHHNFDNHLAESVEMLKEQHPDIPTNVWDTCKARFAVAYKMAENDKSFIGRLVKVIERIQSQHDYIRFSPKKQEDGEMPADALCNADLDNKLFSLNYVKTALDNNEYAFSLSTLGAPIQCPPLQGNGKNSFISEELIKFKKSKPDAYDRLNAQQKGGGAGRRIISVIDDGKNGPYALNTLAKQFQKEAGGLEPVLSAIFEATTQQAAEINQDNAEHYNVENSFVSAGKGHYR